MSKIPPRRILVYLLIAGLLPIIGAATYSYSANQKVDEACREVSTIYRSILIRQQKQARNMAARQQFAGADHRYVDNHLESMHLLSEETAGLTHLVEADPSIPNKEIVRRLAFLTEGDNRITFVEGRVENYAGIQERHESLAHPVEVDLADLKRLLAAVEQVPVAPLCPNPPQLIISDFKLKRQSRESGNEVFVLDMKLIKREFE